MSEPAWRARLRSPLGQLQLMALCLLGAGLLGGLVASQPAFFRGKQGLELKPRALSRFDEADRAALRAALMDGDSPGDLGARLAATAPEPLGDLLLRALIAGTAAQRRGAMLLAAQSPQVARAPLIEASQHADRTGDQELRALLDGSGALPDIVRGTPGKPRPAGGVGDE